MLVCTLPRERIGFCASHNQLVGAIRTKPIKAMLLLNRKDEVLFCQPSLCPNLKNDACMLVILCTEQACKAMILVPRLGSLDAGVCAGARLWRTQ
eukprot:3412332-Amphidinium_carterae.1